MATIKDADRIGRAMEDILTELRLARTEHKPMASAHEGYAVILEELDELWDEIKLKKRDPDAMRREALQLTTMGLRFILDICDA
jgi:hypothetical protein